MYFSLLAAYMAAFFWVPWEIQRIFGEALVLERAQIFLDNAAIVLGREDRDIFQYLVYSNRKLEQLERIHHFWHTCAKVPKTAAYCGPKDLNFEIQIREFHRLVGYNAKLRWKNAVRMARNEWSKFGGGPLRIVRSDQIPIGSLVCHFCGLPKAWEIEGQANPIRTRMSVGSVPELDIYVCLWGKTIRGNKKWDYSLELGSHGFSTPF